MNLPSLFAPALRGAARQVHDVAGLVEAVARYFEQPELRKAAGRAAHTLVAENRGALDRTVTHVEETLFALGWRQAESAAEGAALVAPR